MLGPQYSISDKAIPDQEAFVKQFFGTWKFVRKHNFDDFLKGCGINYVLRKTAGALTPTEVIGALDEGEKYFMRTDTIVKSATAKFNLGEEFNEETIDGRKMKTTFTIVIITDDSGTEFYALLQSQIDASGRKIHVIRFIRDEKLMVIMKVDNVEARALFEA